MDTCIISRRVKIPKKYIVDGVEKDLTIIDNRSSTFATREPLVCYKKTRDGYIVPRIYGLKYIKKHNLQFEHTLGFGDPINVSFNGKLRPQQIPVVDQACNTIRSEEGSTLHLYCGFGKTTCASSISCILGVKTLVLVHTKALALQWKERIEFFVKGSSVGTIRQDVFDIKDKTHVIASMQSICKRDYGLNAFESFGLTIVDEAHHVCANELSKCLNKAGSRYRLGLTATPYRKDGYTPYLFHSIGEISSSIERSSDTQELNIEVVQISRGPDTVYTIRRAGGKESLNIARMINDLCESESRTLSIIEAITQKYMEGRQTVILSDRREHLRCMARLLDQAKISEYGFLVGGMKDSENVEASTKKIIFATYAYCSEGVDIPSLDTLVLCTPRRDVVQCVGRILRKYEDKQTPLVVDFVDIQRVFKNQSSARNKYYKTLGANILHLNQDLSVKKISIKRKKDIEEDKSTMLMNFFK